MCRCLCSSRWLLHTCLSRLDYCNSVLVGLPANLIQRLQSVQNAAAWLIYSIRRSEHITDALISLHWLRVQERIVLKVAVLTYRAVHGTAPPYLSSEFTHVADGTTRSRLRLSSTDQLIVPSHHLSTVGVRAFPVAGAYIWNGLPADMTSAPSLPVFRQHLKTVLFHRSYPNTCVIWILFSLSDSGPSSIFHTQTTLKNSMMMMMMMMMTYMS